MKLSETRALVSGGASGLGRAVAMGLVGAGGRVMLLDLPGSEGPQLAHGLGPDAHFFAADVTDEAAVERAVEASCSALGGLNLAICCAGIAPAGRLLGREGPLSAALFRHVLDVNLTGTMLVARAAAAAMRTNTPGEDGERGLIVLTASIAAFEGQIGQIAYAASKGGLVAMTLPLARELASAGIRAVCVAPGLFHTPLLGSLPPQVQQSLGRQAPFPARLGRPEEFAALVAHIVANPMINGTTIRLDGALRMPSR